MDWRKVVEQAQDLIVLKEQLLKQEVDGVYKGSLQLLDDQLLFMVKEGLAKFLVVVGHEQPTNGFEGDISQLGVFSVKVASLNSNNAKVLRSLLPWTAPQAFGSSGISLGLGDRLGLASPGHIKAIQNTGVRPVLAQQSMRELELTNRTYGDVLDAASWAVFQEGYMDGFGADGDHLKKIEDIETALSLGFSMITLDCSEHIDDGVSQLEDSAVLEQYAQLPEAVRLEFEKLYRDTQYTLTTGIIIGMDPQRYHRMILTYYQALEFMEKVHEQVIAKLHRTIDFEISIDEVDTPTTPQDHFFVASELKRRGIKASGVAPRFCGYFEKGIDYVGDLEQFKRELPVHADIAQHFGYKLSVHSGSDKFSVFPIIGKYAKKGYHLKTAGTNWLEAVRVIAVAAPDLYRRIHLKALSTVEDAKKYYKVSLDLSKVPDINELANEDLPEFLNQNDARQVLHITYGFILQDPELHKEIYTTLIENETLYEESLCAHIRRHLEALGL